jgi:hypothetical protein
MVQAKTCADPGVALNPPVPQPQFTYSPGTGVLPMIGEPAQAHGRSAGA